MSFPILLLTLWNVCIDSAIVDFTNCPVSRLISKFPNSSRKYNSYPLVFYDGSQKNPFDELGSFRKDLLKIPKDSVTYPCNASAFTEQERELLPPPTQGTYICSDDLCPISNSDIRLFRESYHPSKWLTIDDFNPIKPQHYNAICKIASSINQKSNNEIYRLFMIGGSVPLGVNTFGYHVEKEADITPYAFMVHRYLRRKFNLSNNNLLFYNFAWGGFTSDIAANLLYKQLADIGFESFTANDIILIDTTLNDYAVYDLRNMKESLMKSVEMLIRKILFVSEGTGPSIYYVHTCVNLKNTDSGMIFFNKNESTLSEIYLKVASHYGLSYLSYFDLLWNPNSTPFRKLLRLGAYGEMHPPWHVHLLIADMIARSLEIDMENCNKNKNKLLFDLMIYPVKLFYHRCYLM